MSGELIESSCRSKSSLYDKVNDQHFAGTLFSNSTVDLNSELQIIAGQFVSVWQLFSGLSSGPWFESCCMFQMQ